MDDSAEASRATTRLRVLSGEHAGVFIDWIEPQLKVGASEDFDVYIGDWNAQQIELQCEEDGRRQAFWQARDGDVPVAGEQRDGDSVCCPLENWIPVRFGAVILCIGPAGEPWPDDAQLLQRCFVPPPPPASAPVADAAPTEPPRRRYGKLLATATAVTFAVIAASAAMHRVAQPHGTATKEDDEAIGGLQGSGSSSALNSSAPRARSTPRPAELVRRVRGALAPASLDGVELQPIGDHVIVRGVLASRAAVDQVNGLLDNLPPDVNVSRRFVAVPEIIDRLHESIADKSLQVRQVGGSHFEVSGTVDDLPRAREAVQHVAADLVEFGITIEPALQPRRNGIASMSGMMIDPHGSSYVRTRDGVKHILSSGTSSAAAVAMAPSTPASGRLDTDAR